MTLANLSRVTSLILETAAEKAARLAEAQAAAAEGGDVFSQYSTTPLIGGEVVTDEEETVQSWSTVDPLEYNRARQWIKDAVLGGSFQGMESLVTGFVRAWGTRWFDETGRFPTLSELVQDEKFIGGAQWLPHTSKGVPSVFLTTGEDGVQYLARTDPMEGITFTEFKRPERTEFQDQIRRGDPGPAPAMFQDDGEAELRASGSSAMAGIGSENVPGGSTVALDPADRKFAGGAATAQTGSGLRTLQDVLKENPELKSLNADPLGGALPEIPLVDLQAMLAPPGGGGGRGGGGGTVRDIAFDREQLLEATRNQWRTWFIQSADEDASGSIVDEYIREATAFWKGKGGQLDFNTFMRNKLKDQPRYNFIFGDKDPSQSEEQFLMDFVQPISQLGLSSRIESEAIVGAVTSGGSPTAQLAKVARSREARNTSGFTTQLAQTVAGLGAGART